jgi:pilus assembly protein Flp/PilA
MIIKAITMLQSFRKEEDGLALTEYLVLLGLLTAAVIAAITLLGGNIGIAFDDWADWVAANTGAP